MIKKCPVKECQSTKIKKTGSYYRRSDSKWIPTYQCKVCNKCFSAATFQKAYRQNKRRLNYAIYKAFCSGMSQRRIALILGINRKTVARKLLWLANCAEEELQKELSKSKAEDVQIDDLITIEHTKCKPLAISLAVENPSRTLLGIEVSVIPASGHLAEISRKKYGYRPNKRPEGFERLLKKIKPYVSDSVRLSSDEDPLYPPLVKKHFPNSPYRRFKGGRGCITGQGELKKLGFDPLFSLNHTCAMLRANINRLFRRTWCTTKKPERLKQHLLVYMHFHNTVLLKS